MVTVACGGLTSRGCEPGPLLQDQELLEAAATSRSSILHWVRVQAENGHRLGVKSQLCDFLAA